jgi:hypothetical protein
MADTWMILALLSVWSLWLFSMKPIQFHRPHGLIVIRKALWHLVKTIQLNLPSNGGRLA